MVYSSVEVRTKWKRNGSVRRIVHGLLNPDISTNGPLCSSENEVLVEDSKKLGLERTESTCWMVDSAVASETAIGSEDSGWPLTEFGGGATAKPFTIPTTDPTVIRTGPFASIIGFQKASRAEVRC